MFDFCEKLIEFIKLFHPYFPIYTCKTLQNLILQVFFKSCPVGSKRKETVQLLKLFMKYFNKDVTVSTSAIFRLKGADSQSIEVN